MKVYLIRHVAGTKNSGERFPSEEATDQLNSLKSFFSDKDVDLLVRADRWPCEYTQQEVFGAIPSIIDQELGCDLLMKSYHRYRSSLNIYPLLAGTEEQLTKLFLGVNRPHKHIISDVIQKYTDKDSIVIMTHGGVLLEFFHHYFKVPYKEVFSQIECGCVHELDLSRVPSR